MPSERLERLGLTKPLCIYPTAKGRRLSGLSGVYAPGISRQSDVRSEGSCCPLSWALPLGRLWTVLMPHSVHSGYETVPEQRPRWFHTSGPLCPLARPEQTSCL